MSRSVKELFFYPQRASHAKRANAARRHAQVRLGDALELEQRLVVKPEEGRKAEDALVCHGVAPEWQAPG